MLSCFTCVAVPALLVSIVFSHVLLSCARIWELFLLLCAVFVPVLANGCGSCYLCPIVVVLVTRFVLFFDHCKI